MSFGDEERSKAPPASDTLSPPASFTDNVATATANDATIAATLQAMEQLTSVFGFDIDVAQQAIEAVGTDVTAAYNYILDGNLAKDQGGPIVPIFDCPHVQYHVRITPPQLPSPQEAKCQHANHTGTSATMGNAKSETLPDGTCPPGENWVCLQCGVVRCSRYINGHGVVHYDQSVLDDPGEDGAGHCIAASLADLSVWCHACTAYLRHPDLDPLVKKLEELKFANDEAEDPSHDAHEIDSQHSDDEDQKKEFDNSDTGRGIPVDALNFSSSDDEEDDILYPFDTLPTNLQDLARFIQTDACRSIVVLAGAGMSVASGIPDFRSAGGLYETLQPDLLTATAQERDAIRQDPIFALEHGLFLQNPLPCLELIRPFILGTRDQQWKATLAHRFVELLHAKTGKLTRLYTQNIDGLEGQCQKLPRDKVVAVHGSMDRAECALCGSTSDFGKFCTLLQQKIKDLSGQDPKAPKESTPIACELCGYNAVKPAVVLFRSTLPQEFFERVPDDISDVDLLIIIGTSLTVAPANSLVYRVPSEALRVVVNREPVGMRLGIDYSQHANRDFFAQGDVDAVLLDLMAHLGWLDDLAPMVDHLPTQSAQLLLDRISSHSKENIDT